MAGGVFQDACFRIPMLGLRRGGSSRDGSSSNSMKFKVMTRNARVMMRNEKLNAIQSNSGKDLEIWKSDPPFSRLHPSVCDRLIHPLPGVGAASPQPTPAHVSYSPNEHFDIRSVPHVAASSLCASAAASGEPASLPSECGVNAE